SAAFCNIPDRSSFHSVLFRLVYRETFFQYSIKKINVKRLFQFFKTKELWRQWNWVILPWLTGWTDLTDWTDDGAEHNVMTREATDRDCLES
ncbi:MAG: hypothetical protein IKO93_15085, partial [Lentisphaeria bacterium]|nr:hypothetical protein [Lentisphaeria bacterium]